MSKHTVTLTDNATGKQVELEVLSPTQGPKAIDIRRLYAETGMFTYDPGYMSTASCSSGITYMDGGKGLLEYRGYPIEQLAEESSFLETCYLLMNGDLPTTDELAQFTNLITRHSMLHEALKRFFEGFRRDGHPMAIMVGVGIVCFLSRLH